MSLITFKREFLLYKILHLNQNTENRIVVIIKRF